MAELISSPKGSKQTRTNPRIDLTPMVDLGFLLITFFIMTTSMTEPKAMDIQMPYKPSDEVTAFHASSAITLIPSADHRIYYYEGVLLPETRFKVLNGKREDELRAMLIQQKKRIANRALPAERSLQVLIKADASANVDDIVLLFDEMNIQGIKYVALVDIHPREKAMLKAFR
jgi:biopolymer transport protein ExbD